MNRQSHTTPSADSTALPDARSRSIRPWCGVRANNFPRTYVHRFVSRMCRGILLTAGTVGVILAAASTLAANKIPTKLPNGEIPWEPINDANLQKIVAALPDKPQVPPLKPRKLLVFYRTDRFVHGSIPEWNRMLELLGEKTGAYRATLSQSYDDLTPERLKEFDAVFFNNTCRMMTPEPVKAALMDFVKSGKGFAGNHGSGDNWQDWGDGRDMLGAVFNTHPFGSIQIKIDDSRSPLTAVFGGKAFPFSDEIYAFTAPYSREKLRVLLSVDHPNSPNVQKEEQKVLDRTGGKPAGFVRPDHDYAISWIRAWGNGRVFYCSLGHGEHVTWDPAIVRFNLAGIQYALGDLKADDTPVK